MHGLRYPVFFLTLILLALPGTAQQTFTVTTTADSGTGSLRDALTQANATAAPDSIAFAIDGGGSYQEIFLQSSLLVSAPVTLEGSTQGCNTDDGPCIRLDGGNAALTGLDLIPGSDSSTVTGLLFTRFGSTSEQGRAVHIHSSGNVLGGCGFGVDRTGNVTDPDGTPDSGDELGNRVDLVLLDTYDNDTYPVQFNAVTGNIFGGSASTSIILIGAMTQENHLYDNAIGVGLDGETLLGVGLNSIEIKEGAAGNLIGADEFGLVEGNLIIGSAQTGVLVINASDNVIAGNVISGHVSGGVALQTGSNGNTVFDNRIGTTPDGLGTLPNGTLAGLATFNGYGVQILSGSQDNLVEDNLLSGNLLAGVILGGINPGDVTGNRISDNWIGLDATGTKALGNGFPGVAESGVGIVLYGQVVAVEDNVIAGNFLGGNSLTGIGLDGTGVTNNTIFGNGVGLGTDETTVIPNGQAGLLIRNGPHGNTIGGRNSADEANAFLGNPVGIAVAANSGTGNAFAANFFERSGSSFPIDLGLDGPTANDTDDADDGPNSLQNHAAVSAARVSGGRLFLTFSIDTAPANAAYPLSVQLYAAEEANGLTLHYPLEAQLAYTEAEAQTEVTHSIPLTTDEQALTLEAFTVVVTDADGNTSEMSLSPTTVATEAVAEVPQTVMLSQNYPNPFNPTTRIAYALPQQAQVRLEVFDLLGRRVAVLVDEAKAAGAHTVRFDATGLPSGTYLYRLQAGDVQRQDVMVLLK